MPHQSHSIPRSLVILLQATVVLLPRQFSESTSMPVIPSDVAFTHPVYRWHARQSIPSPPVPTSSTPSSTYIIPIVIVVILVLVGVGLKFARNAARTTSSTRGPPHRVVQAPPGTQRGPIIAEILAGGVSGTVVRQEQESTGPTPARSSPSTADRPSQATTTNCLPSPDDDNFRSRTPLDAGVTQADAPPGTIIHRDAGPASQDDEAPPDELPPPYSSIGSP